MTNNRLEDKLARLARVGERLLSLSLAHGLMILWLGFVALSTFVWLGGTLNGIYILDFSGLVSSWLLIGGELLALGLILKAAVIVINKSKKRGDN